MQAQAFERLPSDASESLQKALAAAWLSDAVHASSAAERATWLALGLIKLRAPDPLVESALSVGTDHMSTMGYCLSLARRHSDQACGLGAALEPSEKRRDVISLAVRDGVAESLVSAYLARAELARCTDVDARDALVHRAGVAFKAAHLATRILGWLLERDRSRVRSAIADEFRQAMGLPMRSLVAPPPAMVAEWHAHGRLLPEETKRIAYIARRDQVAAEAAFLLRWSGLELRPAA